MSDFILTIDSDDEVDLPQAGQCKKVAPKQENPVPDDEATLNPDLNFDLNGGFEFEWETDYGASMNPRAEEEVVRVGTKPKPLSVDDIIERHLTRTIDPLSKKRKRDKDTDSLASEPESVGHDEGDEGEVSEVEDESEGAESDDGFGVYARDDAEDEGTDMDEDPLTLEDEDSPSEGLDEPEAPYILSSSSDEDSEQETQVEKDRKAAFFAPIPKFKGATSSSFLHMNLSRSLVRAITKLNFITPTPIQTTTIPVALEGHDVLGSAVTGSGKTAAFMIPILERLMYRDKSTGGEIRVLILVPTRELAVQCADVGKNLARFMDVTFGVVVGGLSLKAQEVTLRARPDVVIATPGRLIDHLHNTHSFSLAALDILVLDEADRMLSDGFSAELAEIIQNCPKSRQTMLFSATMTDDVDQLVKLSMNRPVRLFVDPKKSVAKKLVQEFVRVRKESDRQAILITLCRRTAKRGVIVFFRSKALCHQIKVVFGLLGMKGAELHGNLSQEQRLDSLRRFRHGQADFLLATDLASRGLDIRGVQTVINYDMPGQLELYLHRVGRTARASDKGRSISLVGESDRKMLKAVIKKSAAEMIRHRVLDPEVLKATSTKLEDLKDEVAEVLKEEKEERAFRQGEMEIKKTENMLEHHDEIFSRPRRTWFMNEKEKDQNAALSKEQYTTGFSTVPGSLKNRNVKLGSDEKNKQSAVKRDKFAGLSRRQKRRKLALEDETQEKSRGSTVAAVRSAKKAQRPSKIGEPERKFVNPKKQKALANLAKRKLSKVGKGGFDAEAGVRSLPSRTEGMRAKRTDPSILGGKKGGKGNMAKGRTKSGGHRR